MKKIYFFSCCVVLFGFVANAQIINFVSNPEFKKILIDYTGVTLNTAKDVNGNNIKVDANNDGQIQVSEALNVYKLDIEFNRLNLINHWNLKLTSLQCIQYFTNLTHLNCGNHYIENVSVTPLVNLVELNCDYNYSTILDVVNLSNLKKLSCVYYKDSALNLTGLIALENLILNNSRITSLNLAPCVNLKRFEFRANNYLNDLTFSGLNSLEEIIIEGPGLINLTLNNLASLKVAYCCHDDDWRNLINLNMSGLYNLEELYCSYNKITNINLSGFNKLRILECNNNKISGTLDLLEKKDLRRLYCYNNLLTNLLHYQPTNLKIRQ